MEEAELEAASGSACQLATGRKVAKELSFNCVAYVIEAFAVAT